MRSIIITTETDYTEAELHFYDVDTITQVAIDTIIINGHIKVVFNDQDINAITILDI